MNAFLLRVTLWWLVVFSGMLCFLLWGSASLLSGLYDGWYQGRPLAALTRFLFDLGLWYFLFPAAVLIAAIAFTFWRKPSPEIVSFMACIIVSMSLLFVVIFAMGAILPIIPTHIVPMGRFSP